MGNMRTPEAVDVLVRLLDDDEVAGHAIIGLGKLKEERAARHIRPFLTHPKSWVRQEAKRSLAKIEKAAERKK
jgi:HEAT repeat protein